MADKTDKKVEKRAKSETDSSIKERAKEHDSKTSEKKSSPCPFLLSRVVIFLSFLGICFLVYQNVEERKNAITEDNKDDVVLMAIEGLNKNLQSLKGDGSSAYEIQRLRKEVESISAYIRKQKPISVNAELNEHKSDSEDSQDNGKRIKVDEMLRFKRVEQQILATIYLELNGLYSKINFEEEKYNEVIKLISDLEKSVIEVEKNKSAEKSKDEELANKEKGIMDKTSDFFKGFVSIKKIDKSGLQNNVSTDLIYLFDGGKIDELEVSLDKIGEKYPSLSKKVRILNSQIGEYSDEYLEFDIAENISKLLYLIENVKEASM